VVDMEAPKAAVHVPFTLVVRKANEVKTALELLVVLEAVHLG